MAPAFVGNCSGPVTQALAATGAANGASPGQALQRARVQAQTILDALQAAATAGATCPVACPNVEIEAYPDYDSSVPQYRPDPAAQGVSVCTVQLTRVLVLTCSANPPAVFSIAPTEGPVAGGTSVAIEGSGLIGASAVTFGGVPATFSATSDSAIAAASPPAAAAGEVDVIVTSSGGTSAPSPSARFTYS